MPRILAFLILSLACLIPTTPAHGQQQLNRTIDVDGVNRRYLVYLPAGFDPAENMPVMFHYHGGDGFPEDEIQYVDYRPLANQHRFIAVYPAASVDPDGCTCWNGEGPYSNGIDELGFTSAMLDAVIAEFNADPNRLYASGFSLGGSMMYDLFCHLGDRFAAIGAIAANMWQWTYDACDPAAPTGFIHILGTSDFYAPYNGNKYSLSVNQQNAYLVSVNGSETRSIDTPIGGGVTEIFFPPGESCHSVAHYRRQDGGHDVPAFAISTIWEYASQFDVNGLIECGDDPILGDLNLDGVVNAADLGLLFVAWSTPDADLDGDGTTSSSDVGVLLTNWS
jgi:polyhydroxybutyrate depolymerase